jgi:hypothetical protein
VTKLVEKLEAYKKEFVPEAAEKESCHFEIAQTKWGPRGCLGATMRAVWLSMNNV